MKKTLAFILALVTVLVLCVSCGETQTTQSQNEETESTLSSAVPTDETGATVSTAEPATEVSTLTPVSTETPTPEALPSSYTLVGSKHLPIPDNQGSIGSCSSEGVTYTQFTVAVSQYMNANYPDIEWDPSSGNGKYIFSPKFTYNFSGAGTVYAYEVLKDDGCLPMSLCITEKTGGNKNFWGGSNVSAPQSRSWEVGKGMLLEGLKFRLTGYEENEFIATNNGQLTTNEYGEQLLYKIKDALNKGNAVAIGGWSSYWKYTTIDKDGTGTLGKRGENVIWNGFKSAEGGDGNHVVAIIGYDDDITVTRAGVTMKGAFLIRNSWGDWMNDGNCWLMYDACNKLSEHKIFNIPEFYQNVTALSIPTLKMYQPYNATNAIYTTFEPAGSSVVLGEKSYDTYYLSEDGFYLSYGGGELKKVTKPDETCVFAILPYDETVEEPVEEYKGSSLLLAVNAENGPMYLSTPGHQNAVPYIGDDLSDPAKVCFVVKKDYDKGENGSFRYMLHTKNNGNVTYERTGTIYRFCFTYWDKDITVGLPALSVEADVTAINRDNLFITITRTDKNGVQDSYAPAAMRWHYLEGVRPGFSSDDSVTYSFSGKENPTKAEKGYFTFGYHSLTSFGKDFKPEDYLWGIEVRGSDVTVNALKLIDGNGKVICEAKTGMEKPLEKGEIMKYVFDLGGELKAYAGSGTYKLKNVGTGKILTLSQNNMTFAFESGKKDEAEKSSFRLEYREETDSYYIWNYKDTYVLDVTGSTVKDGTKCQLNALRATRTTQDWTLTQTEEGYLKFSLMNNPDFAFGYNGKDFCVSSDNNSDNYLWVLEATSPVSIMKVEKTETGVKISADVPAGYTSGKMTVKVITNGTPATEAASLDVLPENGKITVETALDSGTYLFIPMYNGKICGTQTVFTV